MEPRPIGRGPSAKPTRRHFARLALAGGSALAVTLAGCDPRAALYFLQPFEPQIAPPCPALKDKKVGDSVSVTLEPEDAFGDYDTDLMRIEPLDQLPPDVAIGGHLVSEQDGNEMVWRITDIADGKAVLDGNHELAGQRLRFDCKVLDIRPATQEEISHGHVHGAHGHHH